MTPVDTLILIEEQRWDELRSHLTEHPEEARRLLVPSKGQLHLHVLCSLGSTPSEVVTFVARLYPEAVTIPDTQYGDTPLHMAARHSQTSDRKIRGMLALLPGEQRQGVLLRNKFGGTVLHSAANHNAVLGVLQALVEVNPRLLNVSTHDGIAPISALYTSYINTIPGYMTVARILKGEVGVASGHFERFWAKAVFMSTANQTPPEDVPKHRMVLHGLLQGHNLVNFYKLALKWDASLASVKSSDGNLPLHVLVERRPFRLKEKEAITATLEANNTAAGVRNVHGDLPLFLAIRNKMPFHNGMDAILEASRSSVACRDPETKLLPFQLAAAVGGKVAVDNTFHILQTQPDLLSV